MSVAALLTYLVTATAGLFLLTIWLIEYDHEFQTAAATRLPVPVISAHALLAVTGLAVWGVYLLTDRKRLAWATVVILVLVAVLGFTMAVRWVKVYRTNAAPAGRRAPAGGTSAGGTSASTVPPERHFPVSVVIGHGVFAMATLTLVLLTAFGELGS
jgi:hypothetical protein